MSIVHLQSYIDGLDREERRLANRIFDVDKRHGELDLPTSMEDWADEQFDTSVEEQTIVRVKNLLTGEESLFNALRSGRPKVEESDTVRTEIEESRDGPFCNPQESTPADTFGRVEGEHCITASNVAKYDAEHGLIIFDDHDPLSFTNEEVRDYVGTAEQWFLKADGEHEYLLWHCLWKSAASIVHGHMQVLASPAPYGRVEELTSVHTEYEDLYEEDYYDHVYRVHDALGLAVEEGDARLYASLAPRKEKGIVILNDRLDDDFADALYRAVSTLRDDWGVESFTVGTAIQPDEQYPVRAEVIDRGSLEEKTGDVGAMELFAGASVVATDPFEVAASL